MDQSFKNGNFTVIAGPCSLESESQIRQQIEKTASHFLRAGIYKMRTAPTSFQGMRSEGIELIKELKNEFKFKFISEVVDEKSIQALASITDMYQVGTRNMYNYELLKSLNQTNKPVLLKRGMSATVSEWLKAASYIDNSTSRVILCERGVRSFESSYRNMLDINAVSFLKNTSDYKVFVDPSHASGNRTMIADLSYAAMAAGADGLLIEAHHSPDKSVSDASQAIDLETLNNIVTKLRSLGELFDKKVLF